MIFSGLLGRMRPVGCQLPVGWPLLNISVVVVRSKSVGFVWAVFQEAFQASVVMRFVVFVIGSVLDVGCNQVRGTRCAFGFKE